MSHLHELPPQVLGELVTGAVRTKISAGSVTHREGEPAPHLELVISGVVRAFVTAPDGRTMTIRYCRPGALLGAVSLFATRFTMPGTTQALVDAELLRMSPAVVRRAVARDTRVAQALLCELSDRVMSFIDEIPGNTFATVRQRVARHLLDRDRRPGQSTGACRRRGDGAGGGRSGAAGTPPGWRGAYRTRPDRDPRPGPPRPWEGWNSGS